MIPVRLHRNGAYWLARWSDGGRSHGKSLGRRADISIDQAADLCRRIEARINAGRANISGRANIGQWLEAFLDMRESLSEKSESLYRRCGARLAGFLGANTAIDAVTSLDAMQFRSWLSKHQKLGAMTVFRVMVEARAIFQAAADTDILPKNPFAKAMPGKPKPDRTWRYVEIPVLERLLAVAPGPWRAFLGLTRLAGLRQHEALGLKWASVDLLSRRLRVIHRGNYQTTKGRTREVPIVPELHDVLFAASMDADGANSVCGLAAGSLHRGFAALCARAGVEPWPRWCQALRKSRETDWGREFPIQVASDWLGNSPQVALAHYTKPTEADYARATASQARDNGKTDSLPVQGDIGA